MTEAEWLDCADPMPMLEFLGPKRLDSRLRRLAVECCRRVRYLIAEGVFRAAADAGEAFADDPRNRKSTIKAMALASIEAWRQIPQYSLSANPHQLRAARSAVATCAPTDRLAAFKAMQLAAQAVNLNDADCCAFVELQHQAVLVREIFGNPFCPAIIDSSWLAWNDGTIPELAQAIYDQRAFDRLPILADALEVAGCTNADILNHCRHPGPHVRGCWVVDLILGKE